MGSGRVGPESVTLRDGSVASAETYYKDGVRRVRGVWKKGESQARVNATFKAEAERKAAQAKREYNGQVYWMQQQDAKGVAMDPEYRAKCEDRLNRSKEAYETAEYALMEAGELVTESEVIRFDWAEGEMFAAL